MKRSRRLYPHVLGAALLKANTALQLDRRVVPIGMLHHNCLKVKRTVCDSEFARGFGDHALVVEVKVGAAP